MYCENLNIAVTSISIILDKNDKESSWFNSMRRLNFQQRATSVTIPQGYVSFVVTSFIMEVILADIELGKKNMIKVVLSIPWHRLMKETHVTASLTGDLERPNVSEYFLNQTGPCVIEPAV